MPEKQSDTAMGRILVIVSILIGLLGLPALAQDLSALARALPENSSLVDRRRGVDLNLDLSQAVPYRVFGLTDPQRIVIDFNEVDFSGLSVQEFEQSDLVDSVRVGLIGAGWSRMVLNISQPLAIETAALLNLDNNQARVFLRLVPTDAKSFQAAAKSLENTLSRPADNQQIPLQRQVGDRPVVVVLDPGHGGIDPGAERGATIEAKLMLTFARELKEVLLRTGNFKVVLTRDADVFVPLEARVSLARQAGADVFLSLHADALVDGRASGSTIYTLSETATDLASQQLAERHDRDDLLAGIDLSDQDDVIAGILMALARTETIPRTDRLADALVTGLSNTVGMHKRPRLSAGFSVLKAPDIPSVLLELGFLSSKKDREQLEDAGWRHRAALGIRDALLAWAVADAADALLVRK